MKGSGSWADIKSEFTEQLASFKKGELEADAIIKILDSLLAKGLASENSVQQELSRVILEANLPPHLGKLLSTKLVEQKTQIISPQPSTADDHKHHLTHSSSLLQDLLRWDASTQSKSIKPGQIIRGTYCLDFKIGSGGMGEVWKALDLIQDAGDSKDKYVAIKFINHEIRSHPDALKALVREFARYKKLIHPNIVKAYELNRDESEVFIVMEYLDGTSLKQFIKQNPGGISLKDAQPIIQGMCDALAYAHHEGIVHLDFKPGNVFFNPLTHISKVIDFGIARLSSRQDRDKTRFDPGSLGAMTTAYASTEMLMEADPDPRDDIYGLACVVYELLAGHHPFDKNLSLKAEREKMRPKPIPGLSSDEFKAILHGLSFHRDNRTASARQFYDELLLPGTVAEQKRWRKLIAGSIITTILIAVPIIAYQVYDNWQLHQVRSAIKQQHADGMEDFSALDIDEQTSLVNEPAFRLALLELASAKDNAVDVLQIIDRFDPAIQQIIYSDQQARSYLISQYIKWIDQALHNDDFRRAELLSRHILQLYPDSIQLAEHARSIQPKKLQRTESLQQQFQQCLADISTTLTELFPCLLEAKEYLAKIDDSATSSTSVALTNRYQNEILAALKNGDSGLVERLLGNWETLEPSANESRTHLEKKLEFVKQVNALSEQLRSSDNRQLSQLLKKLPESPVNVRQEVLSDTGVKQRLLQFYQDSSSALLSKNSFKQAFALIAEGITLLSGNHTEIIKLKTLEKSIHQKEADFLDNLSASYQEELQRQEPDVTKILAIIKHVSLSVPENALVTMPGISEQYAEKIEAAIDGELFALSERLFHDWQQLKPADSDAKAFISLRDKNRLALNAYQNRHTFGKQLQEAINSRQLEQVNRSINLLKTTFSAGDQQKIIHQYADKLHNFFQSQIDTSIQQNAFATAQEILVDMKNALTDNKQIASLEKHIVSTKISTIKQLLNDSQSAIDADLLNGQAIFSPLSILRSIDNNYLNQHNDIFLQLKNRLIKLTDNEKAIPQLVDVINQWEKFINGGPSNTAKNQDTFNKSKNYIALRCLVNGKKFKRANQQSVANEYFMFGLSLEPIQSVRVALEKELLN